MEIKKVRIKDDALPLFQKFVLRGRSVKPQPEWFVGDFMEGWEGSSGTYYLCQEEGTALLCGMGNGSADIIIDEQYVERL